MRDLFVQELLSDSLMMLHMPIFYVFFLYSRAMIEKYVICKCCLTCLRIGSRHHSAKLEALRHFCETGVLVISYLHAFQLF